MSKRYGWRSGESACEIFCLFLAAVLGCRTRHIPTASEVDLGQRGVRSRAPFVSSIFQSWKDRNMELVDPPAPLALKAWGLKVPDIQGSRVKGVLQMLGTVSSAHGVVTAFLAGHQDSRAAGCLTVCFNRSVVPLETFPKTRLSRFSGNTHITWTRGRRKVSS